MNRVGIWGLEIANRIDVPVGQCRELNAGEKKPVVVLRVLVGLVDPNIAVPAQNCSVLLAEQESTLVLSHRQIIKHFVQIQTSLIVFAHSISNPSSFIKSKFDEKMLKKELQFIHKTCITSKEEPNFSSNQG